MAARYRVTRRTIRRFEGGRWVSYEAGHTLVPTEAELRAFGDRLEPVEEGAPPPESRRPRRAGRRAKSRED